MKPQWRMLRKSRLPIEAGLVEAPITATARGTKIGPSEAVTARRSRSPQAAMLPADSSTGKSTV